MTIVNGSITTNTTAGLVTLTNSIPDWDNAEINTSGAAVTVSGLLDILSASRVTTNNSSAGANITFTSEDSTARLIPIFDGGQLTSVQIDDPGVGYTFANLNVTGNGTGALISADLSPGDVNTLQATIELLTVDGRIMNIPVISGGWGYGGTPTVTITGDGTGAVATATVDLSTVERRLDGLEKRLDELAERVSTLKLAAPASDDAGFAGALAALEARVSSYIGRGK
jgi:hypothetical protein